MQSLYISPLVATIIVQYSDFVDILVIVAVEAVVQTTIIFFVLQIISF